MNKYWKAIPILLVVTIACCVAGCKKKESPTSPDTASAPVQDAPASGVRM